MTSRWPGSIGAVDTPASGWDLPLRGGGLARVPDPIAHWAIDAATVTMWERTCRRFPGCVPVAARAVGVTSCAPIGWRAGEPLDLAQAFAYPVRNLHRVVDVSRTGTATTVTSGWWLEGRRYLHRDGTWPWAAHSSSPTTGPGWWIEAAVGVDPPALVLQAVADLADQFVKSRKDPSKCELPDRVASLARRGLTMTFVDPSVSLGVPLVDEATRLYGCHPSDSVRSLDPARYVRWQDVTGGVPDFTPCAEEDD